MKTENDILFTEDIYEPDFFDEEETEVEKFAPVKDHYEEKIERFNDYSHERSKNRYEEYEVVQTFTPKTKKKKENNSFRNFLDNQYAFSPSSETYIYQRSKPKKSLPNSTRGRILVSIIACIALLLSSLCIVNAININTSMLENASDVGTLNEINKGLETSEDINDELKGEITNSSLKNDYYEITNENSYKITLLEKQEIVNYKGQTNFFDKICNFISNLFGG